MKLIVKGKSEKAPFRVEIPQNELVEVLCYAMEKANEEHDEEMATSPGGFPTALFTCVFPAKAREEVGWDLKDGWSKEKALAAFDFRLERKQGGGGFSLETRQKTWDEKADKHYTFSPTSGAVGNSVTITGTNFSSTLTSTTGKLSITTSATGTPLSCRNT